MRMSARSLLTQPKNELSLFRNMTSARLFSASGAPGSYEAKFNEQAKSMKISPAAGIYLRGFGVLPSQITATGPKGHITK